jgi:hypothetical protein
MEDLLKNYKYRSRDAALLDLLEGGVFFSKPSQFHANNDKLEGEFIMETNASTFMNSIIEAVNAIKITRGEPPNSHMNPIPSSTLSKMISKGNEDFIKQAGEIGICSTSTTYDNQAMWSHYCKNEGLCFEFEWDQKTIDERHLIVSKVEYSNKPREINRDTIFKDMLIDYGTIHPELSINDVYNFSLSTEFRRKWMYEFIRKCSCIKNVCWEYENEIRLISPKSESFDILKKVLKSVYMFIPQFNSPDFQEEIFKSRQLRMIWVQLADKYPDVKLFGLSFDKSGKLNKEGIVLRKYTK